MSARLAALVLIAGNLLAVSALGQESGPRSFGRFSRAPRVMALNNYILIPKVQVELELKDDQLDLLIDLNADVNREINRTIGEVLGRRRRRGRPSEQSDEPTDQEQRQKRLADLQARLKTLQLNADKLVLIVLEADQGTRIKQIRRQHEGVRAFQRDEFNELLKLEPEQVKKIRTEMEGGRIQDRLAQLQTRVDEVLTDEQKARWEELKGSEFEFPSGFRR